MPIDTLAAPVVASVNGVALNAPLEALDTEELRQRACTELLRQAAQRAKLLDPQDWASADGVISAAAAAAIDALLERELVLPEPADAAVVQPSACVPRRRRRRRIALSLLRDAVSAGRRPPEGRRSLNVASVGSCVICDAVSNLRGARAL